MTGDSTFLQVIPRHHLSLGRAGAILSDKAQQGLVTLAGAASG